MIVRTQVTVVLIPFIRRSCFGGIHVSAPQFIHRRLVQAPLGLHFACRVESHQAVFFFFISKLAASQQTLTPASPPTFHLIHRGRTVRRKRVREKNCDIGMVMADSRAAVTLLYLSTTLPSFTKYVLPLSSGLTHRFVGHVGCFV